MTLPALLSRIGWSVPHLAARIGMSVSGVYGWHRGRNSRGAPCEAPEWVIRWLEKIAQTLDEIPPDRYRPR